MYNIYIYIYTHVPSCCSLWKGFSENARKTGHSVETWVLFTPRIYALSSSETPTVGPKCRGHGAKEKMFAFCIAIYMCMLCY